MAPISANFFFFFFILSTWISVIFSASVVEDLNNLHPPPDFNSTIVKNCFSNPSLRYCSSSPMDHTEIFKSTIVASHLCNESRNPNCVESFPRIDLRSRPKIAPLYLSFSFFWKYCPLSILSIDFSNSSLKGSFPIDVLKCTQIQALDLSQNDLTGDVPLQSFSALSNLTVLNLSYNHFSESKISDSQFFKRFNSSSFISSGLIPDHRKYTMKVVILLIGFPIFVILIVCFFEWLCFRRPDFLPEMLRRKHRFTPAMLKAATNGFSEKNLMAKCDGVDIYNGVLRDGTEVRVEIYWNDIISRETNREFIEECKILTQLCHENLVQVLGWCDNRRMRSIVTVWTEGESVATWLSRSALPWKRRLRIAKGVLEGMIYLQEEWPVVSYDLRTSSLWLSRNLVPLISRFKVGNQNSSTRNIYKFGVFLLEMIANRQLRDEIKRGESGFIAYVKLHYPQNLQAVMSETISLRRESMVNQAKLIINLALMCTEESSSRQPNLQYIFDTITRLYECCLALPSSSHKIQEVERGKGHKRIQPR